MRVRILISAVLLIPLYSYTSATIINIPADYLTIQQGIDASIDGDTVLVQPGTYVENINFNGHNIVLGSLFLTTGDTSYISQTVIDGNSAGSVIRTENYVDSTSVVAGFTIQNGYSDMGGGIHSRQPGIHIIHNIIRGNVADSLGGGIYCFAPWRANPQIANNIIENNSSEIGGGICTVFRYADISNNTIINNHASISGGGLAVNRYGGNSINGNFIANNVSDSIGGGISFGFLTYSGSFNNNQIIGNNSTIYGGGIHWDSEYHLDIENCNIYGNTSSQGGGIYAASGVVRITNSILWADTASVSNNELYEGSNSQLVVSYSGIQGGWSGNNVLDVDPVFRDPLSYDFHLQDSIDCGDPHYSPYIDAGNPEVLDSALNCNLGLGSDRSDIGAFGGGDYLQHIGVVINIPDDYPTIQQGINASLEGDTIRIAPGIYYELIEVMSNIVIGSHYMDEGDTSFIYSTIIDGNQLGPIVKIYNNDSTSALVGLTIRNGRGWTTGGIYLNGGNPFIKNNRIINNRIPGVSLACYGAGIKCYASSPKIINNTISYNVVEPGYTNHRSGGGISCDGGGSPVIAGNYITYNSAPDYGGGIYVTSNGTPIITNNYIANNSADFGGAICCTSDSAVIVGNMVLNNATHAFTGSAGIFNNNIIANNTGIGVYAGYFQEPLINNIIYGNEYQDGGGIYSDLSSVDIINCIIWGNTSPQLSTYEGSFQVSYSDIEGGYTGIGNISAEPAFRDINSGDFHLMSIACGDSADSPCIDAGDPNILDSLLDCSWGLGTTLSDMGAYGGGDSLITAIFENYIQTPGRFALMQNYPNPFNPTTTIRFSLPEQSEVALTIYNILGQQVATLFEGIKHAGAHTIIWNATDFPSGIYFARLEAGDSSKNIKMLLLK